MNHDTAATDNNMVAALTDQAMRRARGRSTPRRRRPLVGKGAALTRHRHAARLGADDFAATDRGGGSRDL